MMYSDLFSDLTQKMAPQPIKGSQLSQKRMEFQFRWQLITNHSVFARFRNVQITGVGGLIHSCNIVNPYQTWNQTCSVCVKVSKHTFWSAFGALHCAIYGNVFNISRETSFGNLGDNMEITSAMWAEPATTGEGGDYLGDEPDSKNASTLHFDISEMDYSI